MSVRSTPFWPPYIRVVILRVSKQRFPHLDCQLLEGRDYIHLLIVTRVKEKISLRLSRMSRKTLFRSVVLMTKTVTEKDQA